MNELIKELEYNQKINKEKGLENKIDIGYVIERLEYINVWFEVAKNEVITAIEDIYNDDLYKGYEEKLEKISDDEINSIAWRIEDYNVWDDVYDYARSEILAKIESEEE
jgi:hypothetical protein